MDAFWSHQVNVPYAESAANSDAKECSSPLQDLPTQDDFLAHGIIQSCEQTEVPPEGTRCAVCLEDYSVKVDVTNNASEGDDVVYLSPCRHFFHKACILRWFTSTRPERDTCPNCRKQLFAPDELTAEQIIALGDDEQELAQARLPWGPHREPTQDEIVVDWATYTLDTQLLLHMGRENGLARLERRAVSYINVTQQAIYYVLSESDAPLRPLIEEHCNGFLRVWASGRLHFWTAAFNPNARHSRAWREYNDWVEDGYRSLGELASVLAQMEDMEGLFMSDTLRVVVVPRSYAVCEHGALHRILDRGPRALVYGTGVRGWMRRIFRSFRRVNEEIIDIGGR